MGFNSVFKGLMRTRVFSTSFLLSGNLKGKKERRKKAWWTYRTLVRAALQAVKFQEHALVTLYIFSDKISNCSTLLSLSFPPQFHQSSRWCWEAPSIQMISRKGMTFTLSATWRQIRPGGNSAGCITWVATFQFVSFEPLTALLIWRSFGFFHLN